jgi:hypothetical protein
VIRSDNNPIGDYCEFLVAAHYGVTPERSSNAGHDVTASDGSKIQVKGRRIRPDGRTPPHFSGALVEEYEYMFTDEQRAST